MEKKAKFLFFNVGRGDSTLLELPSGEFMLIDNKKGGKVDVRKYLKSILPKKDKLPFLDYFVLTHAHADHVGSVNELFEEFDIGEVWYTGFEFKAKEEKELPEEYIKFLKKIKERASSHNDHEITVDKKEPLEISIGEVKFQFISPSSREVWDEIEKSKDVQLYLGKLKEYVEKAKEKNLSELIHVGSLVGRVTYKGSSVLITGDSELLSWKYWIMPNFSKYCFSKLLHAPHHGSKSFFISPADSEKDEPFDENTEGCYTDGLIAIGPSIVVVTNKTKPGEKDHESPPNEYALKLYKSFKNVKREIYFTSDGTIEYVIPDEEISRHSDDIDQKFINEDSEEKSKSDVRYERPRKPAVVFPNKYGK